MERNFCVEPLASMSSDVYIYHNSSEIFRAGLVMPNFIKIIHLQVVITEDSVPIVSLYLWFFRNVKANSVFTNLDLNLAEFVIRDPLINVTRFLESINFVQGEKERDRERNSSLFHFMSTTL